MNILLRGFACALAVLLGPAVGRAEPPSDFDQRAAAALYAAKDGNMRESSTMNEKAMSGLRRYEKDAAKKTAQYILGIGDRKDGMDYRGLMRIAVGEALPPPAAGWVAAPQKPASVGDAEVMIQKVETDADKFNEIAIRKSFGNITLLARQRRPLHEPIEDATKAVAVYYDNLLKAAQHYKLFIGKMRLLNMNDPAQPDLAEVPLACLLSDQQETQYVVRAEVIDNDGQPMTKIKKMSFMLKGRLASLAKVKAGGVDVANPAAKFDINDPSGAVELIITFPKLDEATHAKVLQDYAAAKASGEAPLWFRYTATFK